MRQNAPVDVSVHEYKPSKANHCAGGQPLPDLLKHGLWMLGPPYINPPASDKYRLPSDRRDVLKSDGTIETRDVYHILASRFRTSPMSANDVARN